MKKHATENTNPVNGDLTLCGVKVSPRIHIDNADPNCKKCEKMIRDIYRDECGR